MQGVLRGRSAPADACPAAQLSSRKVCLPGIADAGKAAAGRRENPNRIADRTGVRESRFCRLPEGSFAGKEEKV